MLGVRKVETLLDIDIRRVLERVGEKYGLKLPRKVVTVDYGDDVGDQTWKVISLS